MIKVNLLQTRVKEDWFSRYRRIAQASAEIRAQIRVEEEEFLGSIAHKVMDELTPAEMLKWEELKAKRVSEHAKPLEVKVNNYVRSTIF